VSEISVSLNYLQNLKFIVFYIYYQCMLDIMREEDSNKLLSMVYVLTRMQELFVTSNEESCAPEEAANSPFLLDPCCSCSKHTTPCKAGSRQSALPVKILNSLIKNLNVLLPAMNSIHNCLEKLGIPVDFNG
jgi:hypothetical protein